MGELVADGMGNVVQRHFPAVVGLHGEGGVDAAELLDRENPGNQKRLWRRIKAFQNGKFLAQPRKSLAARFAPVPQLAKRGKGVPRPLAYEGLAGGFLL